MSKHHIIIGDGVTAAEFATTRNNKAGDTITIVGPDVANLGRGIAYAKAESDTPWRYAYLLNSPSRSVDQEFSQWVIDNWEVVVNGMTGRNPDWLGAAQYYVELNEIASLNAPREFYGDFNSSKTREKLAELRSAGINIQMIPTRAVHIEQVGSALNVITEDGQQIKADSVDVATGGPTNQRFAGDDDENSYPELFGHEQQIAAKLKNGGRILCIGASAAMLDLLRFCQSIQSESHINFTAISPSGRVLKPLRPGPTFTPAQYQLTGTFKHAADFLTAIKSQQQQALDAGYNFYESRVGLRSLFINTSLDAFLPDVNEARKVALPLFKHFEGGTRDSIDDFNRLLDSGNTRIIAGRVQKIECTSNNVASVFYSDATGETQVEQANVVINCAGPGRENNFDRLTNDMLRQNWISICPHSGGILAGRNATTPIAGVRYLGPAVTSIGDATQPVPLYDAYRLRLAVQKINKVGQT